MVSVVAAALNVCDAYAFVWLRDLEAAHAY
jgi:hypothetical protein